MKKTALLASSIFAAALLVGCGGGGGSDAGTPAGDNGSNPGGGSGSSAAKTGTFVDSPVEGLRYVTDTGVVGETDKNGKFKYNDDDQITFYVGKLELGTGKPDKDGLFTPQNFQYLTNEQFTRTLILLQSLDEDSNLSNGIAIPDGVLEDIQKEMKIKEVDLTQLIDIPSVKKILEKHGDATRFPVDEESAITHFEDSMNRWSGGDGDGTGGGMDDGGVFYAENGLMWQDNKAALYTQVAYSYVEEYCSDMTLGGFYDWRVPTVYELRDLVKEKDKLKWSMDKENYIFWARASDSDPSLRMFNFAQGQSIPGTPDFKDDDMWNLKCVRGEKGTNPLPATLEYQVKADRGLWQHISYKTDENGKEYAIFDGYGVLYFGEYSKVGGWIMGSTKEGVTGGSISLTEDDGTRWEVDIASAAVGKDAIVHEGDQILVINPSAGSNRSQHVVYLGTYAKYKVSFVKIVIPLYLDKWGNEIIEPPYYTVFYPYSGNAKGFFEELKNYEGIQDMYDTLKRNSQ